MSPDSGHVPTRPVRFAWLQALSAEGRCLCVIGFISALGFGIQAPAIPVFGQSLGVGSTVVGLAIGVFSLARLLMAWPAGRLLDRFGEYWILIAGLAIAALGSLGAGLSTSAWELLLHRTIGGAGSVLYSVSAMGLILRTTPAAYRGRASGLFMGAYYIGTVSGPAIGSLLVAFSARLPFFVYALCSGAAALVALWLLRHLRASRGHAAAPAAAATGFAQALRMPAYRAALANNFAIGFAVYGVRMSVLPLFLLVVLQQPAQWIGIALTLGAITQTVLLPQAGRLTDSWGRKPNMILGLAVVTAGYAMILLHASLPAFLGGMALMGVGAALAITASTAASGDAAGERGGAVIAGYQMFGDLGMTIGPVLIGIVAERHSYALALLVTIGILLLTFVPQVMMPRERRP